MRKKDMRWVAVVQEFQPFFRGFAPLCAYCEKAPATHYLGIDGMVYGLCDTHQCICGTSAIGSHLCDSLPSMRAFYLSPLVNPQRIVIRPVQDEVRKRGIPEAEFRRRYA